MLEEVITEDYNSVILHSLWINQSSHVQKEKTLWMNYNKQNLLIVHAKSISSFGSIGPNEMRRVMVIV